MTDDGDWECPTEMQPDPETVAFDLERTLSSVMSLRSEIPEDAFSAPTLGTERGGNGVVIGDNGLVLTIGYLITEAETVWLVSGDGTATPASRPRRAASSCGTCHPEWSPSGSG